MDMESFFAAMIIMMSLSVATFQVVRNYKYKALTERRHRLLAFLLYTESALVASDLIAGGEGYCIRFLVDLMLVLIPLSLMSSSTWNMTVSLKYIRVFLGSMILLAMYHLLCFLSLAMPMPIDCYIGVLHVLTFSYVLLFLYGIWLRVREVKAVMQTGTVWAGLSFIVDSVYVVFVLMELLLMLIIRDSVIGGYIIVSMITCTCASYGIRIIGDSLFVFYRRHERRIVESMKISPVEVTGIGQRECDMFKDIYDRIVEYFEAEKPFLNGDLTINDIVSVVFTNKLYISRAISQYTGRNFCQFVNYHRVMYSVECFRNNPELKVTELWPMCGFNTIVSYNMAFRLFMGENPSDWCRKEKIKLFKKGK